jgi:hypothetical protein
MLRSQATLMKHKVDNFDPSSYGNYNELHKEYKALSNEIRQELLKDGLLNQPEASRNIAPPLFVILVSRSFFGFLMDEHLLDFHLNWINWVNCGDSELPTLKKYFTDMNSILEKIDLIIADPVKMISPGKIVK